MSAVLPATELVPLPDVGRRFVTEQAVRLGDVDPSGRLRLDATARLLQDVANDDALDADLDNSFGWVVRRTLVEIRQVPLLGEPLRLTTFCSGSGRSWAERRTSIAGGHGGHVEAVALWVQVDPNTRRPTGLGPDFERVYGKAAGGRRVSTRLSLPGPPARPETERNAVDGRGADEPDVEWSHVGAWTMRQVDLDVLGHVNNAVAWAIVHEVLGPGGVTTGCGEIEYLAPVGADAERLELRSAGLGDELTVWLVADDVVRVAARWRAGRWRVEGPRPSRCRAS